MKEKKEKKEKSNQVLRFSVPSPTGGKDERIKLSASINAERDKVKIKKLPIHIKKVSSVGLLKQFAAADYGTIKEGRTYEPANDNRSFFFQEEWRKAQKEGGFI